MAAGPLSRARARRWARAGVLASLALVLGYVETFIPLPVPVPGIKLGLGNIAVLAALLLLDVRGAAAVAAVKVLAAGFLFGNPLMMLYSAGGTALAFAAMAPLSRIRGVSVVLVAIVGAMLHNVGQIAVASVMLGTGLVWYLAPVLLVAGAATGAVTGAAARYAIGCLGAVPGLPGVREERAAAGKAGAAAGPTPGDGRCRAAARTPDRHSGSPVSVPAAPTDVSAPAPARTAREALAGVDARAKLAFLAVFIVAALHAATPVALGTCLVVAVVLSVAVRLRPRELRAVLAPLAPIVVFTAVMQVLCVQSGAVLLTMGGLVVTADALAEALRMVACLLALMLASVSFMHCTTAEELVGTLRWLLAPLRRVGVAGDAFVLSVSVALGFLPVLVDEFRRLKMSQAARLARFDGGLRGRLGAYLRLFAPLLRSSFVHADALADALLARGFSCGPAPTSLHPGRLGARELACLLAAAALAVVSIAL